MTVYADLLFLINFSMDLICLYICLRLLKRKIRRTRLILGATLGGVYSVVALFITAPPALALLIDGAVCLLISFTVFYERERTLASTLPCALLYVGVSMLSGGCMTVIFNLLNRLDIPLGDIGEDGPLTYVFAVAALVAAIASLSFGTYVSRRSSAVECILSVRLGEREVSAVALCDSGNLAKDPLGGKNVIFLQRELFSALSDPREIDAFLRGELMPQAKERAVRLIPINTAAGRSMAGAISPDAVTLEVDGKIFRTDALISPINMENGDYRAIVPAEILKP